LILNGRTLTIPVGKSFKGKPADIWAAGGTLYYFMFGRPPFQGFTADEVKHKILEKELEFPADITVNPEITELIKACLIKDPDQRITLDQIMVLGPFCRRFH